MYRVHALCCGTGLDETCGPLRHAERDTEMLGGDHDESVVKPKQSCMPKLAQESQTRVCRQVPVGPASVNNFMIFLLCWPGIVCLMGHDPQNYCVCSLCNQH